MYFYLSILTSMVRQVIPSVVPHFGHDFLLITDRIINSRNDLQLLHNEIAQYNPSHLILRNCVFNVQSLEDLFANLTITDIDLQFCDISRVIIFSNALRNITFN